MTAILHETPLGYITLEKTGKSNSYVVWINVGTSVVRRHTLSEKIPNAFERAKDELALSAAKTFCAVIWEKAEHWTFNISTRAENEKAAIEQLLKDFPRKSYTIRSIR